MERTHLTGGSEWLVDALECDPVRLCDMETLLALGSALVEALDLHVIGAPLLHRFDGPGGVTGLYLLSESHLAWHTYPETGLCTLNVYCCRPRPALDWEALLRSTLAARRVLVTMVRRGIGDAADAECRANSSERRDGIEAGTAASLPGRTGCRP